MGLNRGAAGGGLGAEAWATAGVQGAGGALRCAERHQEQGDKLGQWLVDQRATHKRGALEARRVQASEECGVRWSVRVPS